MPRKFTGRPRGRPRRQPQDDLDKVFAASNRRTAKTLARVETRLRSRLRGVFTPDSNADPLELLRSSR